MKSVLRICSRLTAAGLLATTITAATPQDAEAQSVFFAGFTQGCFGAGCTPGSAASRTGELHYTPSSFSGALEHGRATVSFGTFRLVPERWTYDGQTFTLLISFIGPIATSHVFVAAVQGTTLGRRGGLATVLFNPFTVQANGPYTVRLNPLELAVGQSAELTGEITSQFTSSPEPVSLVLLGTGLLGLGAARRRRTRLEQAD